MEREIYLTIWKNIFHIWNTDNVDLYNNNVEEDELKKSFFYKIISEQNNARIVLLIILYQILDLDLYDDYIWYDFLSWNKFVNIYLKVWNKKVIMIKTTYEQLEKVKNQVKDKIYTNINEWLIKNIMHFYNIENEINNENSIDILFNIISVDDNKKIKDVNKLLEIMKERFIKNTVLR